MSGGRLSSVRVGDKFRLKGAFYTEEYTISKIYNRNGRVNCRVSWVDNYGVERGTDYLIENIELNFDDGDWVCPRYIMRLDRLKKLKKLEDESWR